MKYDYNKSIYIFCFIIIFMLIVFWEFLKSKLLKLLIGQFFLKYSQFLFMS